MGDSKSRADGHPLLPLATSIAAGALATLLALFAGLSDAGGGPFLVVSIAFLAVGTVGLVLILARPSSDDRSPMWVRAGSSVALVVALITGGLAFISSQRSGEAGPPAVQVSDADLRANESIVIGGLVVSPGDVAGTTDGQHVLTDLELRAQGMGQSCLYEPAPSGVYEVSLTDVRFIVTVDLVRQGTAEPRAAAIVERIPHVLAEGSLTSLCGARPPGAELVLGITLVTPPSVAVELTSDRGEGGGGGPNLFAIAVLVVLNMLAFGSAALRLLARRPEAR